MKIKRRHVWTIGVAVVAAILVVLLVLIGLGDLQLPGTTSPAQVSVTAVQVTFQQGTTADGSGWLGPNTRVLTGAANGYPFLVAPGGSFSIPLELGNNYTSPVTLYTITAGAPFTFASSLPALPATLKALQDDALLQIFVNAPSSPGASLVLYLTINALPPSS